jgi:hypothetical protein
MQKFTAKLYDIIAVIAIDFGKLVKITKTMTQFSVFTVFCGIRFTEFMVVKTNNYSFTAAKAVNLFA